MRADVEAPPPEKIAALRTLLGEAKRIVGFTGAGISTAAGIPDFRSPGGIWTRMEPITYPEFIASEEARMEDWRRRFVMNEQFATARPTVAHLALAALVERERMPAIVTQNIDGLHQRSGADAGKVIELHGNATYGHCLDCRRRIELDDVRLFIQAENRSPRCAKCDGLIKAAVISFGESMPEAAMEEAARYCMTADLIVVVGTSLVVHPAASLPLLGARSGAGIVIINRESTPLDDDAELVLNHSSDSVFAAVYPQIAEANKN
jgi:NAD-dependent deacetylase